VLDESGVLQASPGFSIMKTDGERPPPSPDALLLPGGGFSQMQFRAATTDRRRPGQPCARQADCVYNNNG